MADHLIGVGGTQRCREVGGQHRAQERVVGQVGAEDILHRGDLGLCQEDREFRHGQAQAPPPALGDLLVARQRIDVTPDPPFPFKFAQVARVHVEHLRRLRAGRGQRPVLVVVLP